MPAWTFGLADHNGLGLCDVRAAVTLTFTRNTAASVGFALDLEDAAASELVGALRNGMPKLRAYRDGELVFNGQWSPMEEESAGGDDSTSDLRAVFRSPFDVLTRRYTPVAKYLLGVAVPGVIFTAVDAGEIAWTLIENQNATSPTGLREGTIQATKTRDRIYENKQVAESILELTAVIGGFDFTETFVDEGSTLAVFNVVAQQGQERDEAVFEHGPGTLGNVQRVVRRWLPPVNRARVLGEFGRYGEASDAGSVARYGEWWASSIPTLSGVVEQATLDDKAGALLRPAPLEIVEFEPDPVLAPQPWDDYWLGDSVPIRSRIGSLAFEAQVRVNSIQITVDEEGNESSHALTFESPTTEVE